MVFRSSAGVFFLLALLHIACPSARAETIDPHALYEQRCARCHAPHAGDFAHDNLARRGDTIVGRRSGRDLRSFLTGGHGKLTPGEIDAMVAHLTAIVDAGALFRKKCFICHGRAVAFARNALILKNGKLYGRYSHRETALFVANHGRLKGPQVVTIIAMLKAQLAPNTAD